MAKNFQRHARGGRFDKQDFGDLGLRAFKNQQDQIIESLKLQQARTNEYSKEYASGIAGVGVSEEKNRNILNSLENQVFENRRQNVQKRGKREIENIESKAKEFGRAFKSELGIQCRQNVGKPQKEKGLGITQGPFLCLKFGRSGRIRTPGHWLWSSA